MKKVIKQFISTVLGVAITCWLYSVIGIYFNIITEIEGVPIYSLQNPAIITNEESIALKEGFCKWIDLKIREERNNN